MSHVVTAPDRDVPEGIAVFVAGGITDCPLWQIDAIEDLSNTDLILLNPRRPEFDVRDPNAAPEQIKWEYEMLRRADAIMFWFAKETLQPITLYELGAWSASDKPIAVGAHPDYPRRLDVVWQTHLARPEVQVVDSLSALCTYVRAEFSPLALGTE